MLCSGAALWSWVEIFICMDCFSNTGKLMLTIFSALYSVLVSYLFDMLTVTTEAQNPKITHEVHFYAG